MADTAARHWPDLDFTCPGLTMPEPENWIACYRAGHQCTSTSTTRDTDAGRETVVFCPCCGQMYGATFTPWSLLAEWEGEDRG